MSHLGLPDILAFGDPALKKEKRDEIGRHMETCGKCRTLYVSLWTFRTALRSLPDRVEPLELTDACVPWDLMGDFLGGRLPEPESAAYSGHVAECDACFERAAFFTRSSVRMTEGTLKAGRTPERFKEAVVGRKITRDERKTGAASVRETIRRWIHSPIPAYAFAASVVLFLLFGPAGGGFKVVDIGSEASFSIYEKPRQAGPSFGFSDSGRKMGEIEAGFGVTEASGGRLRFSWKPVNGADEYAFRLAEITPGGLKEIFSTTVRAPEVLAPPGAAAHGKAYKWTVAGATASGRVFTGSGQFAIVD